MKNLGVLLPRELPRELDGLEVDGWSITGYYNDELTCRNALFWWLRKLPLQSFPEGKDTAEVVAWTVETREDLRFEGEVSIRRPLYRADVRIPVILKGDGDE